MVDGVDTFQFEGQTDVVCTFHTDELTALCPFDFGGPDFYEVHIRYVPDGEAIESKSLKKYIESYRNTEITAEELGSQIYDDLMDVSPSSLYVRVEQARRGGIEEIVEVGDDEF